MAEIQFAQKLASNDRKIRDKALKSLKKYLHAKSASKKGFSEDDFMKIWKGLYYCMWMCDKPLPQEELADKISSLIDDFVNADVTLLFIRTFFLTMSREWFGIDSYRIEKFMMFVRRFLRQIFIFLKRNHWSFTLTKHVRMILEGIVINPNSETPLGFKLHLADIYIEELERIGGEELTAKQGMRFLLPYCRALINCDDPIYASTIIKEVFHYIIARSDELEDDVEEEDYPKKKKKRKHRVYDNPTLEVNQRIPVIPFKSSVIVKKLFQLSKDNNGIKPVNRKKVYHLIKQFKDLERGIYPLDRPVPLPSEEIELTEDMIDEAAKDFDKQEAKLREETRLWKLKMKKLNEEKLAIEENDQEDMEELFDPEMGELECFEEMESVESPKKRKKVDKKKQKAKKIKVDDTNLQNGNDLLFESGIEENMDTSIPNLVPLDDAPSFETQKTTEDESLVNGDEKVEEEVVVVTERKKDKRKKKRPEKKSENTFGKFDKFMAKPPAFFKVKAKKNNAPLSKILQESSSSAITESAKKVNFLLSRNKEHDANDYLKNVKESPQIPFNSEKKPVQGVLKKTLRANKKLLRNS